MEGWPWIPRPRVWILGLSLLLTFLSSVLFPSEGLSQIDASHVNNWAVLVGTSRNWFNYRHISNTLAIYRSVRRLGIPDERIILMLADDAACNVRNPFPSRIFKDATHKPNVYGNDIQVDYKGEEVTVENFMRLITGRHHSHVPKSKRLLTDEYSNVLVYFTGHGGNEFLKFRDVEEIQSHDLAQAINEAYIQKRFKSMLVMTDTCQATTLHSQVYSPGVIAIGSSLKDESSYSYYTDLKVGVSVIDRFTFQTLNFLEKINSHSNTSLLSLFESYDPTTLMSHSDYKSELFPRPLDQVLITEFFGSKMSVEVVHTLAHDDDSTPQEKKQGKERHRSIFTHEKNSNHCRIDLFEEEAMMSDGVEALGKGNRMSCSSCNSIILSKDDIPTLAVDSKKTQVLWSFCVFILLFLAHQWWVEV